MIKRKIFTYLLPCLAFVLTFSIVRQHKNSSTTMNEHRADFPSQREAVPASLREGEAYHALKWYNKQRTVPTGIVPENWRENALVHIKQNNLPKNSSVTSALSWTSLGPNNIGGRTRSIAINPSNTNIMYAGSVSGGVWKTTDGGVSWNPTTDAQANLAISSIVIDPAHPDTIYAGTGEGYFPVDGLRGAGVLKSTDGGATWTNLKNFSTPNSYYSYYYITKLVIRPDNPSVLYAGMIGGIWKTTNGGTNWTKLTVGSSQISCVDLVADPSNPNVMYAAFGLFYPYSDGIYKTTDGGSSWVKKTNGFPSVSTMYTRISLAVSASNPSVIYASLADSNYYTHSIQKSTDAGASWFTVANGSALFDNSSLVSNTHLGGQGWYNNVIAVNPSNEDTVYAGGINVFKSTNGGTTWNRISDGYAGGIHVDQHVITFNPSVPSTVFFANDGGVFNSTNSGSSFSSLNNNLITTQFYSCDVDPTLNFVYGGTQDNGTLKYNGTSWSRVIGGDGGPVLVDSATPTTVFGSYIWLNVYKSTDRTNFSSIFQPNERSSFIAPLAMSPSNSNNIFGGTYRIYRTISSGTSWSAISNDLTGNGGGAPGDPGSTISAIAVAKTSSAIVYVGTTGEVSDTSSRIWVTTNGLATPGSVTWTNVTKSPLPNRSVTAFAIDRTNASRAFVTFSGYNTNTPTTTGHVFLTTNQGSTWSNVSGDLPDVPANTIVVDPINTNHVVVGTDLGIFETTNGGTNWTQQNSGLANVAVAQLVLRTSDGILYAATHGRGMFKTMGPLAVNEPSSPQLPHTFQLNQNYPNPFNPSTIISYQLHGKGFVNLTIYNMLGEKVAILVEQEQAAGAHSVEFNSSSVSGGLPSGVYFYRLNVLHSSGGESASSSEQRKMLLLK